MKKSMYFKTKDDVLEYYGALENIPSTDLVIVEDTGSMYAVSNNASINGEMTPTGGDAAPDSPWIETEDLASILGDPKSLELPLHIDAATTCISSSFNAIKDSEENITSVEYIEVINKNGVTTIVKVIVNDNENGDLSNITDLEYDLIDYRDDIYNNIYPILTDCTLSIYEEGGNNTRSMAPQYVLEGKIYAWNLCDKIGAVEDIAKNGLYLVDNQFGFHVNVSSGGSSYTISSAYMYDMSMQNVGNYTDGGTYMAYSFTLDSTTPNAFLGSAVNINNTYNCGCNFSMEINNVEGNGSYTSSMNVVMQDTVGGTSNFSLGANTLMEQPNLSVDFLIKLYKDQGLYGFPVDIDYTISGFTPLVISSMSYSLDGGMNYQSMSYDSVANIYSATLNNVSVNAAGMLSPIVKVEYTTGAVKYLNGNVTLTDNGSPAHYPGYWNADPMQQMFYIDNMTGTTGKDITSLTVSPDGNITVNFTDQAAVTVTRVYSEGTSSNTDLVDQGNGTWMLENVRDALVPGRVIYEVYSNNTSQAYQVDHYDSASETLYFTTGNQRDMNNYGQQGWNWLWNTQNKTLSHFVVA